MADNDIDRPEDGADDENGRFPDPPPSLPEDRSLRQRERANATTGKHTSTVRVAGGDHDGPVLPSVTRDESGVGWGEGDSAYSDDWYLSERPPHHG